MPSRLSAIHRNTPKLAVAEPRGLAVRSVDYYRAAVDEPVETRINHTAYDPAGRAIAQRDPRLFLEAMAPANLSTIHSLSGTALCTVSVDAGLRLSLFGNAGQWVHNWDGRGSQQRFKYDRQLRLTALFEQAPEGAAICAERLSYATNDHACADHNQCGRLIRHHESAGALLFNEYALTGEVLKQTRHFLSALTTPDWPELVADRESLLEPGEGATTRWRFNPPGDLIEQIDARNHRQHFRQTVAGQLRDARLQLSGEATPKTLVSAVLYNAEGKVEQETAGNGVITRLYYQPEDGRLARLLSRLDQNDPLLDLNYSYDAFGNVLGIRDAVQPIHYFANQRVDSTSHFVYDSLSRLIEASGSESGSQNKGPAVIEDPRARANYRQTYRYDRGENLLELTHEGPQNHSHRLVAARYSNRCLPVRDGLEPSEEDLRDGFDDNGNVLQLQPGQTLTWNVRNQLQQVRPVMRDGGTSDREIYVYGADGMRVRKVSETQTSARTVVAEVRYLGTLELRTHSGTGERLQVISIPSGYGTVQVLHWETEPPKGMGNDACHYRLPNHLGSCSLELDSQARVISRETYHPFGTTATWDRGDSTEESHRTQRYSGKEKDATGLYYYGFRYYMPWQQRWLSADPAGFIDGLNGYRMVRNNPVNYTDMLGLMTVVELFEEFKYSEYPGAYELAVELDRYVRLEEGVRYKRSYSPLDGKNTINIQWVVASDHFYPQGGQVATSVSVGEGETTTSVLLAQDFVTDVHRASYFFSRRFSEVDVHSFEATLQERGSAQEKIRQLIKVVPNDIDRARLSEIISQGVLAPTAGTAFIYADNEQHVFSASRDVRPTFNVEFDRSHNAVVSAMSGYELQQIEPKKYIDGLHLSASVQTVIGRVDGRLSHDALPDEPVIERYELSYERPRVPEPKVQASKFGFARLWSVGQDNKK